MCGMQSPPSRLSQYVRRSTAESAADQLREAIIYGELPMGAPLSEAAIAERLGISRTPVREAFRLLAQEGLVQLRPFAGANVFQVNREELRQLFDFREMLETAALDAVLRHGTASLVDTLKPISARMREALQAGDSRQYLALDAEFHEAILKSAKNPLLCDAYQLVASRLAALRTVVATDPAWLKQSLNSHLGLIKTIASGDGLATREALLKHTRGTEKMFEAQPSLLEKV